MCWALARELREVRSFIKVKAGRKRVQLSLNVWSDSRLTSVFRLLSVFVGGSAIAGSEHYRDLEPVLRARIASIA